MVGYNPIEVKRLISIRGFLVSLEVVKIVIGAVSLTRSLARDAWEGRRLLTPMIGITDAAHKLYDRIYGSDYVAIVDGMCGAPGTKLDWCLQEVANLDKWGRDPFVGKKLRPIKERGLWPSGIFRDDQPKNALYELGGSKLKYIDVVVRKRDLKRHAKKLKNHKIFS